MPVDKSDLLHVVLGVCDGSIFGDAAKLTVSRKGTIDWCCGRDSRVAYTKISQRGKAPLSTPLLRST